MKKKSQLNGGIHFSNVSFRSNRTRQDKHEPTIHTISIRNDETDTYIFFFSFCVSDTLKKF
jgi:hypothetical protein